MTTKTKERFIPESTWRHFWHPVCTVEEFYRANPSGKGPMGVKLLGETIVLADVESGIVAFDERCPHRSTSLTRGFVEDGQLRCRYHGWRFNSEGKCTEVPACPGMKIPSRAKVNTHDTEVKYGLVWVRLDSSVDTQIPPCPGYDDDKFKSVPGEPYTWPTSAGRRLENFVDLGHFAYVHPNTLYDPDIPQVLAPDIARKNGQMHFRFDPPVDVMPVPDLSLMGTIVYQVTMPFTVCLNLELLQNRGNAKLWMTASPIDDVSCRSFWFTSRDTDLDGPDYPHLAFQETVLNEDIVVIEAQFPPQIPADVEEVTVMSDKISMQYRKWLREMAAAAKESPETLQSSIQSVVENL